MEDPAAQAEFEWKLGQRLGRRFLEKAAPARDMGLLKKLYAQAAAKGPLGCAKERLDEDVVWAGAGLGWTDALRLTLAAGASPDAVSFEDPDEPSTLALSNALRHGMREAAHLLLDYGSRKWTPGHIQPAHLAIEQGFMDVLERLASPGLPENVPASGLLGLALRRGRMDMAEVLLAAGADPLAGPGQPALEMACQLPEWWSDSKALDKLIEKALEADARLLASGAGEAAVLERWRGCLGASAVGPACAAAARAACLAYGKDAAALFPDAGLRRSDLGRLAEAFCLALADRADAQGQLAGLRMKCARLGFGAAEAVFLAQEEKLGLENAQPGQRTKKAGLLRGRPWV